MTIFGSVPTRSLVKWRLSTGWLESQLMPKKITARYPIKGKVLLFATCGFGSLGTMSGLLVNSVFVRRFFSEYGGADGSTAAVNPSIIGISVAYLQASAAVGALIAGHLGDMIGRKRTVRLGGIIHFLPLYHPDPTLAILMVMSFFLPETPRWLAKNGFMQESLQTVADMHSSGEIKTEHVQKVKCFIRYRKGTIFGITVQMFAQIYSMNIISFYLPRPLTTITGMPLHTRANGQNAFIMLYNIVYGFTWGSMPWLLPAEIFPLCGRSKGVALVTTSNWAFNFIIGMVSPDAFASIGGYFYLVIAGLVYFYYVKTADHSLEEIAVAFGDKAFVDGDEEVMESVTAGDEKTHNTI
ncbi:hypothetical protein EJ02DRAFT_445741 [Clathrospora elynae]|uniref:General substrate transporter n=1 Tax=Clathrospora elynae TaxID=706981 RepID=A0A6A5SKN4_9PLEO|nr:hypothetical protein EJ02DRAFT_445741 [Clathrospora elynae]